MLIVKIVVRVLPLVYACAGCSGAAAAAKEAAQQLDRLGLAEMSYLDGPGGGDDPVLVAKARSRAPVLAIDGCQLACASRWLARHGVEPARSYTLSESGASECGQGVFDAERAAEVVESAIQELSTRRMRK